MILSRWKRSGREIKLILKNPDERGGGPPGLERPCPEAPPTSAKPTPTSSRLPCAINLLARALLSVQTQPNHVETGSDRPSSFLSGNNGLPHPIDLTRLVLSYTQTLLFKHGYDMLLLSLRLIPAADHSSDTSRYYQQQAASCRSSTPSSASPSPFFSAPPWQRQLNLL